MDQKLDDWGDDANAHSLAQLDGNVLAIIISTLLVLLSPLLNLQPRRHHMSVLASVMQGRCPHGVFVFHLKLKKLDLK